ncbi:DUF308 domain-containing protein [uncultured Sanguibacteroides sp.]|uniref:HdeD family acid-resistance protein n=1 Tax=uncultured Sanguibacteroides sp. TaxID=1635151 RepID=UPI0025F6C1CE|nr:DUF308 domain-containing protein [uncultured Sanguibacteroides sp.]
MQIIYSSTSYKRSVIKSIIAIVLGLILVLWPTEVLNYTVKIIGAVFFITGLVSLIVSYRDRGEDSPGGLTSFNGIGSIILGLLFWFMADFFTNMLMYLLGFILVIAGIGQLVLLTSARKFGPISAVNYLFPVLILLAGFIVFANPFSAKEGIITFFGITTIFYGVTDLINQHNINKLRKQRQEEEQRQKMGGGEIEDTEYEEVKEDN